MTEPTGYTAVGMVGFTDKGTYSAIVSYVKNDLVHHGGNIWCCLIDDTIGITPTEGTNWTLFVGEPTNMAERIIAPLEVSPSENAYSIGEQLIFNDVLYKAKTAIAVGDALVVDTNIELAPKVTSQIQTLTNQVKDMNNILGAKNLVPLSVKTQTVNGVTITVQDDGSIILNGTATTAFYLGLTNKGIPLESGKCILSGVSDGSMSSYWLFTAKSGGSTLYQEIDGQRTAIKSINGDSAIFDINKMKTSSDSSYVDSSEINIRLGIANGYTCDNVLIKPMIRLASIKDPTYVPYAMTNREITENLGNWESIAYTRSTGLDGDITVRVNRALKLAIISYNSLTSANGGTITLNDATIEFPVNIYSALRNGGFMRTVIDTRQISIDNTAAYSTGSVIAPIK